MGKKEIEKAAKKAKRDVKRYGKRLSKDTQLARLNAEKSYRKLSPSQKISIFAGVAAVIALVGAAIGRSTR